MPLKKLSLIRNGGIGRGWYEDDPDTIPIANEEVELNGLFAGLLKSKLDEVWELYRLRCKEAQDAIKKI